jgi:hypothetical protein
MSNPKRIIPEKPVMEFYEDGEWLRIEVPGYKTRYLKKTIAAKLLAAIGAHAVSSKSDFIIVREPELSMAI